MINKLRIRAAAFSLIELLVVVIIIGFLATLGFFIYKYFTEKAISAEAIITSDTIRKAEIINQKEQGFYVGAADTEEINSKLSLSLKPKYYNFKIIDVTADNFLIIAQRIGADIAQFLIANQVPPKILLLATDKTGLLDSGYGSLLGLGGTSGGNTGGSGDSNGGGGGSSDSGNSGFGGGGSGSGGGGDSNGYGTSGYGGSGSGGDTTDGTDSGNGTPNTVSTPPVTYNSTIEDALNALNSSEDYGQYYYNLISSKNITVGFVDVALYGLDPESILGFWYNTTMNTIYINQELQTQYPEEAIACIICHEAVHADYDYYPQKWIDSTLASHTELTESDLHITVSPGDSIDQEYQAFAAEALLWNDIKDTAVCPEMDTVLNYYNQGEDDFKAIIRQTYAQQNLPEY